MTDTQFWQSLGTVCLIVIAVIAITLYGGRDKDE